MQPERATLKYMSLENPFQDPLRFERRVPECAVVIFGANGDLTKRKLLPALYRLAYERRLAAGFAVLGISRTPMTDDQFREKMLASVKEFLEDSPFDADVWTAFAQGLFYMAGDFGDAALYPTLAARLKEIEAARHTGGNVLFYLSTQPSQYVPHRARHRRRRTGQRAAGWRRIVIEKPFGHDLASARSSATNCTESFDESEVYRIDHYLGKETVQNILAFRFGNGIFEPLWNRRYVNHVQITAAESIGVEGRGAYYQEAGALRDMIQNHLLQVMATIAMEPSATFRPNSVRDERAKLLRSIRIMKPDEVLRNTRRRASMGRRASAARTCPDSARSRASIPDSQTDTYAAVTFFVDNWRWAGVPFYIRTGKRLPKRVTEIAIQFNAAPLRVFNGDETHHRAQSADPAHSAGRRHLAEVSLQASRRGHEAAAGFDGFQLRLELRRALALGLRNAAAGRHHRRCHALHAAGHGGGQLGGGGADPACLGQHQVRLPQLRRGNLGTQGLRRDAGAPRTRLEETLMSAATAPSLPTTS